MKKICWYIGILTMLVLVGCSPRTEYTHALPKDASAVVAMDLQSMAQKAGLSGNGSQKITAKLTDLLKGGLEGDAAKLAEKIVNEPSESGLSLTDKAYIFATPHANALGVLLKVGDQGKLEKLLDILRKEQIASDLKEESGCQWTQLGQALCAFNNGTFLLMQHKSGDVESIKGSLLSLMRQEEGDGFAGLPEFARLAEVGNDIASIVDLSVLPDKWTTPFRMGVSADIRLQDIKYLLTANFEKGRVVVNTSSLTQNSKVLTFYKDMDKVTSPLKGKYMDYFPANTLAWTGGRIHGKAVFDMLCQNPTIRQVIHNPILPVDVERIFSSIEGEYGLGYLSAATGEFLMYADVTNSDFLETFEDLRPLLALTGGEVQLFDTAENQYALKTLDAIYWFGVKNRFFYVTNRRELAEEAGRTYGVSISNLPWAKEGKENRLFASMNLAMFRVDLKVKPYLLVPLVGAQTATLVKALLDECESMNAYVPDWSQGRVELLMKDKNKNPLYLIVQMLENL